MSLVLFLLFFDRFIHRLRPVAVAGFVGQVAQRVITTVTLRGSITRSQRRGRELEVLPAGIISA